MGTPADSARTSLRWIDELYDPADGTAWPGTWGTTPAAEDMYTANFTGETLDYDKQTKRSETIRGDRQQAPAVVISASAKGGTDHEISSSTEIPVFMGAATMGSLNFSDGAQSPNSTSWAVVKSYTGSSNVTFDESDKTISVTAGSAFKTKFVPGQWIRVSGTTNNGTDSAPKYFSIASISSDTLMYLNEAPTDEASVSAKIEGCMVRNGATERSFTLEKQFNDMDDATMISYTGMEIDTWDVDLTAGEIATTKFTWMGKSAAISDTTVCGGEIVAVPHHDAMNCASNVGIINVGGDPYVPANGGSVWIDGTRVDTCIRSVKWTLNNNLRSRPRIGSLSSCNVGKGRCNITGTISAYFENSDLYEKFQNHTSISLRCSLTDLQGGAPAAGNTYIITLPSLKLTTGSVHAAGADQDVMAEFGFEADVSASDATIAPGCMIQIDRFEAIA